MHLDWDKYNICLHFSPFILAISKIQNVSSSSQVTGNWLQLKNLTTTVVIIVFWQCTWGHVPSSVSPHRSSPFLSFLQPLFSFLFLCLLYTVFFLSFFFLIALALFLHRTPLTQGNNETGENKSFLKKKNDIEWRTYQSVDTG